MTEEQKDILIAKMLDAPASMSDEELETIMHDGELVGLWEMSSAVSGAYRNHYQPDIEKEWTRFSRRLRRKPSPLRLIAGIAAVFIGAALLTVAMITLSGGFSSENDTPLLAGIEQPASPDKPEIIEPKSLIPESIKDLKQQKDTEPDHVAETKRIPVSEPAADIDIDEYLRIQQARIENDLALIAADEFEDIINEKIAMLDLMSTFNEEKMERSIIEDMERSIIMVTMQ